jgi:hypothetical protein
MGDEKTEVRRQKTEKEENQGDADRTITFPVFWLTW